MCHEYHRLVMTSDSEAKLFQVKKCLREGSYSDIFKVVSYANDGSKEIYAILFLVFRVINVISEAVFSYNLTFSLSIAKVTFCLPSISFVRKSALLETTSFIQGALILLLHLVSTLTNYKGIISENMLLVLYFIYKTGIYKQKH